MENKLTALHEPQCMWIDNGIMNIVHTILIHVHSSYSLYTNYFLADGTVYKTMLIA